MKFYVVIYTLLIMSGCAKSPSNGVPTSPDSPQVSTPWTQELSRRIDTLLGHPQSAADEMFGPYVSTWGAVGGQGNIYVYRGYSSEALQTECKETVKLKCTDASKHIPIYILIENGLITEFVLGEE